MTTLFWNLSVVFSRHIKLTVLSNMNTVCGDSKNVSRPTLKMQGSTIKFKKILTTLQRFIYKTSLHISTKILM